MNIAIFTEAYPPSVGGQEIRFAEIAELLVEMGHNVSVFCIGHSRVLRQSENINGVQILRFPLTDHYKRSYGTPFRRNPFVLIRYALWCRRVARRYAFEVCIFNQWPLLHVILASKDIRRRSLIDWCEIRNGWLFYLIQRTLPQYVAANIAVSPSVEEEIKARSRTPGVCIPSGIWLQKYKAVASSKRSGLLYLGRITHHKNIPLLISCFGKLRDTGYKGRLTIAGSGIFLDQIKREASASKHASCIDILGSVDEATKVTLLSQARVLVLPSKREGFPRVVAEAMASGLPIVSVDYPENGTCRVLRHYGIGVVAAPSEAALAQAITKVEDDWECYSRAGLVKSTELDWNVIGKKLVGELERITQRKS